MTAEWTHAILLNEVEFRRLAAGEQLVYDVTPDADEETVVSVEVVPGTASVDFIEGSDRRGLLLPERTFRYLKRGGSFAWQPRGMPDGVETILLKQR